MPAIVSEVASETPATWRRIERANDSSAVHTGQASGIDATTATQPLVAPPDAAGATAHGAGAGMMERMVEQVSWWMAQGHQGAELKLELPGGAPVSVSVQVQGNEAHVAFRSDHPAARQWLGDAMPQLRQMLGNEGLMLSGASVGDSGTGPRQEAGRNAPRVTDAGGGRGAVTAVEAPAVSATRPRTTAERSLDLYV
jgi:flagellar hook-length control protein FliK